MSAPCAAEFFPHEPEESSPIDHTIDNAAIFGKVDAVFNASHNLSASYNFDYSKNDNQTFDVATLLLYIQEAGTGFPNVDPPGKSLLVNEDLIPIFALWVAVSRLHRVEGRFDLPLSELDRLYAPSDRDIGHKFNMYTYGNLLAGIVGNARIQARSAQPITPAGGGPDERNSIRKDNAFFTLDWRIMRPFSFGGQYQLIPTFEMFNTFNNENNINPLVTPALFNFDGFLRLGVGDPRQVQLSVKLTF